jgi:SAM-dependent methyltransferase
LPEREPTLDEVLAAVRNLPQYKFQRAQIGRGQLAVNIGCDIDLALLRRDFGAVNVDINRWSASNNRATAADRIHDVRKPFPCHACFDVAILGDILEHFSDDDVALALRNTSAIVKPGGRIVITCPEDYRTAAEQGETAEHVPGVPKNHPRPVTIDMMLGWCDAAGLQVLGHDPIDYGFCKGWGVVALVGAWPEGTNEC